MKYLTGHTPKEDVIDPNSIWATTYCGAPLIQMWNDLLLWEKFFYRHPIKFMLEIGTQFGGLSLFFKHQSIMHEFDFVTIDIIEHQEVTKLMPLLEESFCCTDCFDPDFMTCIESRPSPKMILCDGGWKAKEFRDYAPLLKPGDFIAAHDWGNEIAYGDIEGLSVREMTELSHPATLTKFFEIIQS
jgi:cephalosporin hydroxylase